MKFISIWLMLPLTVIVAIFVSLVPLSLILLFAFGYFIFFYTGKEEDPKQDDYSTDYRTVQPEYYSSYREYLFSDKWRRLSARVKERDNHECQTCGSDKDLSVHHLHYKGIETMSFNIDQLVTLCHRCHYLCHQH